MDIRERHRLAAFATLLVLLASLLGACEGNHFDTIAVRNNTSVALHFRLLGAGGRSFELVSSAQPSQVVAILNGADFGPDSLMTKNGCTIGDLVALDANGREVTRRSPPLCANETWVIEAPGPSGS